MKWICDQKYLKEAQYRSAKNLEARIQLHRRFGLDQTPWTEWLMAKIPLVDGAWVLDIGCGPGTLWRDQLSRLPAGHFILADLSIGMVNTALQDLRDDQRFSYLQADAQEIPVKPGIMDVVLANHMLYHVPEIRQSLSELRRVLKPGGWLCASTNGKGHLDDLYALIQRHKPEYTRVSDSASRFGLENGALLVAEVFGTVETIVHDSDLWVTETKALVDYILSMWGVEGEDDTWIIELAQEVDDTIQQHGGLRIKRAGGVILAQKTG